ncbi:MAG: hypothetical protein A2018_00095 [Alphaproteobacteria bacterium GWF2_58_20]|nr:MAG: hypothetical protein A2018_00095 [Alphaproteobacteria bacterium GWF2_58_20]
MTLLLILVFTLLGSIISVLLAGLILLLKGQALAKATDRLIPYAIGTLLGAAFFGMIPHAQEQMGETSVLPIVLVGILIFFMLEKLAIWRHCHEHDCATHTHAGSLILIGDSLHNFVDGVAIALAFGQSIPLGIATSIAVISHEVPQEVGDFVILLESGYSRKRALFFNVLSSLTSIAGALLTYALLPVASRLVPYLLAMAAASFIYIALADLVPGRRKASSLKSLALEMTLIAGGILTIALLHHHE